MTYRGDDESWLLKRGELARALVHEGDLGLRESLADELAAMDRARRLEAKARLPVIARATIASPCHEPFEAMLGDGAIRSCARCDREVFDVARMTLDQAEALVTSRDRACVRLRVRRDGTLMFADCEIGAAGIRSRRAGALVAGAVIAGAALALLTHPPRLPQLHATPHRAPPSSSAPYIQMMGEMSTLSPTMPGVRFEHVEPSREPDPFRVPAGS